MGILKVFNLRKAKKDTSKLVKKVITNKRGKQQTVYVKVTDEPKKNWLSIFSSLFGFKDKQSIYKKIEDDYQKNKVGEKYSVTWDDWKNHLKEYFINKDKWTKLFTKQRKKVVGSDKLTGKTNSLSKKDETIVKKKKKVSDFNVRIMYLIHSLYGKEQQNDTRNSQNESGSQRRKISGDSKKIQSPGTPGLAGQDVPEKQPTDNRRVDVLTNGDPGKRSSRDVRLTPKEIKEKRRQILDLLKNKTDQEMTEEDKELLRQYEGAGGLKEDVSTHGTLYEYYTPQNVVSRVWDVVKKYIGNGKKDVLEPSAGIGRFAQGQTEHNFDMFEIDPTSARINKILYPDANVHDKAFQEMFLNQGIVSKKYTGKQYDIAIGNPPYGAYSGKYKGMGEGKQHKRYEEYFIDRSLDALKEGGIMAYVVPSSFLRGDNSKIKDEIAKKGKLLEAYRLPNGTFQTTGVGTDIIVIRKEKGNVEDFSNSKYFSDNPEHMLGNETTRTGRFGPEKYVSLKEGLSFNQTIDNIKELTNQVQVVPAGQKSLSEQAKQNISIAMIGNKNAEKLIKKTPKKPEKKVKKETHTLESFNKQYNKKINTEHLGVWKHTNYNGVINESSLTETQKRMIKNSDDYSFIDGQYMNNVNYASGDIYKRIEQLEKDKDKIDKNRYEKQLKVLQDVLPEKKTVKNFTISPISDYAKNFSFTSDDEQEVSLNSKFFKWATGNEYMYRQYWQGNVTKHDIPSGISWDDIVDYIRQKPVQTDRVGDKETNKAIASKKKELRRNVAEKLFKRFLEDGLNKEEKAIIENSYNDKFNSYVAPEYDKIPLFVDGLSKTFFDKDLIVKDVQLKGASFLANKGNGLLAYDVGVGKTMTGIIATVNQLQTGRAKRPVVVVPKAVYKNWIREIKELYPDIKINELDNLGAKIDNEITIEDGTLSIISEPGLQNLTFRDETINTDLVADILDSQEIDEEGRTERERAEEREKILEQLGVGTKVKNKKYQIEDLGFDHVTIDEAHNFKNIFGKAKPSKAPGSGRQANEFQNLVGGTSDRAMKMFAITQYIQKNNNDRNVFALTATPFTNSPIEIYNILSLVARKRLKEMGIYNLHEFMAQYAKLKSEWVVTTKGTVEQKDVMKEFQNLSSLQSLIREYIDKVDGEEAGVIRPDKHTHIVELPMSADQKRLFDIEQKRFDTVNKNNPGAALKAINNMRMSTVSMNLVKKDKMHEDAYFSGGDLVEDSPKLKFTFDTVAGVYKERPDLGQVVYLPRGVPDFPRFREYLIKQGIPEKSIAIIKSGMSQDKIEKIKADFNDPTGTTKIILGSETIQEGINLNGNTAAIYNTLLGWNPSETTQVEGRAWRQGNKQKNVHVVYPQIVDSVDSAMYQKHDEKSKRFNAIWSYKGDNLNVEDINAEELKFELIKDPERRAQFDMDLKLDSLDNQKRDKRIFIDILNKYKSDYTSKTSNLNHKKNNSLPECKQNITEAEQILSNETKKLKDFKKTADKKAGNYHSQLSYLDRQIDFAKRDVNSYKKYHRTLEKEIKFLEMDLEHIHEKLNGMGITIATIDDRINQEEAEVKKLATDGQDIKESKNQYIEEARRIIESQKKDVPTVEESVKKQIELILKDAKPYEQVIAELSKSIKVRVISAPGQSYIQFVSILPPKENKLQKLHDQKIFKANILSFPNSQQMIKTIYLKDSFMKKMEKAGNHKFFKKLPHPNPQSGQKWIYFYNEKQFNAFKKQGVIPDEKVKKKNSNFKTQSGARREAMKNALSKVAEIFSEMFAGGWGTDKVKEGASQAGVDAKKINEQAKTNREIIKKQKSGN